MRLIVDLDEDGLKVLMTALVSVSMPYARTRPVIVRFETAIEAAKMLAQPPVAPPPEPSLPVPPPPPPDLTVEPAPDDRRPSRVTRQATP